MEAVLGTLLQAAALAEEHGEWGGFWRRSVGLFPIHHDLKRELEAPWERVHAALVEGMGALENDDLGLAEEAIRRELREVKRAIERREPIDGFLRYRQWANELIAGGRVPSKWIGVPQVPFDLILPSKALGEAAGECLEEIIGSTENPYYAWPDHESRIWVQLAALEGVETLLSQVDERLVDTPRRLRHVALGLTGEKLARACLHIASAWELVTSQRLVAIGFAILRHKKSAQQDKERAVDAQGSKATEPWELEIEDGGRIFVQKGGAKLYLTRVRSEAANSRPTELLWLHGGKPTRQFYWAASVAAGVSSPRPSKDWNRMADAIARATGDAIAISRRGDRWVVTGDLRLGLKASDLLKQLAK